MPDPPGSALPGEVRALPFQWNLLAWAALVGVLSGLAVVGFHVLLGFINNFLFGPFVEGLLVIGRSSPSAATTLPPIDLPPLAENSGTPLKALLQLGLGGMGLLPSPPRPLRRRPRFPCPPPRTGWPCGQWWWCRPWGDWRWGFCAAGEGIWAPGSRA